MVLVCLVSGGMAFPTYNIPKNELTAPSAVQYKEPTASYGQPGLQSAVLCRTEFSTVWETQYKEVEKEECITMYRDQCETVYTVQCSPVEREECRTVNVEECELEYREECTEEERIVLDEYTETECTEVYNEVCEYQWEEGQDKAKIWVPIPHTCRNLPETECNEVPKTKERLVPTPVCRNVPEEVCSVYPQRSCETLVEEKCAHAPSQKCGKVPERSCTTTHKKVPTRVSKLVPRKVCNDDKSLSEVDFAGYQRSAAVDDTEIPEVAVDLEDDLSRDESVLQFPDNVQQGEDTDNVDDNDADVEEEDEDLEDVMDVEGSGLYDTETVERVQHQKNSQKIVFED